MTYLVWNSEKPTNSGFSVMMILVMCLDLALKIVPEVQDYSSISGAVREKAEKHR